MRAPNESSVPGPTTHVAHLAMAAFVALLSLSAITSVCQASELTGSDESNIRKHDASTGIASYYADKYHGNFTASGEVFDMHKLTAAHRTLPFGTRVLVTRVDNRKTVEVTINDRGPFVEGRVIDLSLAAAKELEMVEKGIVRVTVEILKPESDSAVAAVASSRQTVSETPALASADKE